MPALLVIPAAVATALTSIFRDGDRPHFTKAELAQMRAKRHRLVKEDEQFLGETDEDPALVHDESTGGRQE
jgi:hypothetical protein